jgi:hypothetical protein
MMMERTRENFRAFFFSIERDFHCSDERDTGVHELQIGCIWPHFEVDLEKLGMKGWSGESVEFLTEQMKKADPKAGLR